MTPTVQELLLGNARALAQPAPPESAGVYAASKAGIINLVNGLLLQEIDRGVAVRLAENRAIRALFAQAAVWAPALGDKLTALARADDADLAMSALDRANAALRVALIELQTAVETTPHTEQRSRERAVMAVLRLMADGRLLTLPGGR